MESRKALGTRGGGKSLQQGGRLQRVLGRLLGAGSVAVALHTSGSEAHQAVSFVLAGCDVYDTAHLNSCPFEPLCVWFARGRFSSPLQEA
jgi:hypothetical protein